MKKHIIINFLAMVFLFISACTDDQSGTTDSEAEAQGGELNVVYPQQPQTLDTYVNTSIPTSNIAHHIFETLVTTDSNYEVQPMLADSWEESEDGETITFNLRKGVQFHNGEEMTADDVVSSMNRWIEISGMGNDYFNGAFFEVVDDYTVVLTMEQSLSTALLILAYAGGNLAAIMPEEVNESADEEGINEFIGTGPFKFEEWRQDQHIHLTHYEDYQPRSEPADGLAGEKRALVDDLYFLFVGDSMTGAAGLRSGEYDVFYDFPIENVEVIEEEEHIETQEYPAGIENVIFNKKEGIFTDEKAREAVLTGIDKEAIMINAYSSEEYYNLNHNLMPTHQSELWSSEIGGDMYQQNDPDKAKELLQESGYDGEEIVMISTRDYESTYNGVVVLHQQLEELGINVELEIYDWPTLNEIRENENAYDILFQLNTDKPEPTSHVFLRDDWAGWTSSPELDEVTQRFRDAPSIEAAQELYDEFQEWFYDYIPIVKVGDGYGVIGNRTSVENIQYQDGVILWNVSKNE